MADETVEENPAAADTDTRAMAGAAVMVMATTLLSAATGVVRGMTFSHEFGNSWQYNAYVQAFKVPDLVYFLIAGGAMRTGFIPVFTEYLAQGKREAAWRTFSSLLYVLLIVAAVIIGLGIALSGPLAKLVGPNFFPEQQALCGRLMAAMLPAQVFFLAGGLLMGALNAHRHFLWPQVGPIVYNLVIIAGALLSLPIARLTGHANAPDVLSYRMYVQALSVVVGSALGSFALQLAPLRRVGARLLAVFDLRDDGLRRVALLALPVILTLSLAEINYTITTAISTYAAKSGASWLEYANRLVKLSPRVFGAGVAIVLFPSLATDCALGRMDEYRRHLAFALRNTLFLSIPAAVLTAVMGIPIVRLLYERGEFLPADTPAVANVMLWMSVGTIGLSAQYIILRGFYALQETREPVKQGVVVLGTGVLLALGCLLLPKAYQMGALAATTSVVALLYAALLLGALRRRVGRLDGAAVLRSVLRQSGPNLVLGVVAWAGWRGCASWLGTSSTLARLVTCLAPVAVGLALFLLLCHLCRVEELGTAVKLVVRRFGGRRAAGAEPAGEAREP